MQAPDDCPRPPRGQFTIWAKAHYMGGSWMVVDHTGKIRTNGFIGQAIDFAQRNRVKVDDLDD